MKIFDFLFFKVYKWIYKKWGEQDFPHWTALYIVSFMMLTNIASILVICQFFGLNIFLRKSTPKIEIIFIAILVLGFNYFLFLHKKKYLTIVDYYSKMTINKKNNLILWLYICTSILFFLFLTMLYNHFN